MRGCATTHWEFETFMLVAVATCSIKVRVRVRLLSPETLTYVVARPIIACDPMRSSRARARARAAAAAAGRGGAAPTPVHATLAVLQATLDVNRLGAAGWALVSFEAAVYFIESCLLGPRDDEGDPPDARPPGADDSP